MKNHLFTYTNLFQCVYINFYLVFIRSALKKIKDHGRLKRLSSFKILHFFNEVGT